MNSISIVIPLFNEEKRLEPTLQAILSYCKKNFKSYEIIAVNDGSTDSTREILDRYLNSNLKILTNKKNKGKGYSVRLGILAATHPLVLFTDCDLATPIEEVDKFLTLIGKGCDGVIASRNLKHSKRVVKQPFYRQFMGKFFPLLVNLIAGLKFKDTQCGFKLFKTDVAKQLVRKQLVTRFAFDVELLYLAKKFKLDIKEAPVLWVDKPGSTVNLSTDVGRMFIDLIKIRLNDLSRLYD